MEGGGGMEMIALQAVKCAAVLRTLCGHRATRLLNPLVEERDGEERRGEERRGEERTHMHTRLVNTMGCSLLSCERHRALLVSLFLAPTQ